MHWKPLLFFTLLLPNIFAYPGKRIPKRPTLDCAVVNRNSSEPYISGDSFRSLADHLFDETDSSFDPQEVKQGDIIFVKTDYLDTFFKEKHPFITAPYILISHNSDFGAPAECESFLADKKIIAWFGQNATITGHPKFIPIPIGLANQCWPHGNIEIFNNTIGEFSKQPIQKKQLLGINFRPGTNASIRKPIYDYFITRVFCVDIENNDLEQYLKSTAQTQFILSPPGNGIDCHRTWEALLLGAIPIVESSPLDTLFTDLPVLIIKKWESITPEYLEAVYAEMSTKGYSFDKIYFSYWKNLIYCYQKTARDHKD